MQISRSMILPDVVVITPDIFEDHRGEYVETYNERIYKEAGIAVDFVQDDISVSTKGVLRGIHGDNTTWKLITCLFGKFFFVVVNCIENSPDFGKHDSFVLSDRNRKQILVPPNYGNGHLILSDSAIFHYKQSTYYDPGSQFSFRFDDPRLNIWWPLGEPMLSRRDQAGGYVG